MQTSMVCKLVGLTASVALIICPPALAGNAGVIRGNFQYQEVPPKFGGETHANHVLVSVARSTAATTVTLSDPAGIVVADTSCRYVSEPSVVSCTGSPTAGVEIDVDSGNDSVAFQGAGIHATVYGGSGDDVIHGGSSADVLAGSTGNDRISGLGGSDLIFGGPGSDTLSGGTGNDRILGSLGIDVMRGGPGLDHIDGLVRDFARR